MHNNLLSSQNTIRLTKRRRRRRRKLDNTSARMDEKGVHAGFWSEYQMERDN
jgi:hypothetical protein